MLNGPSGSSVSATQTSRLSTLVAAAGRQDLAGSAIMAVPISRKPILA
jgi:hypothetical protein